MNNMTITLHLKKKIPMPYNFAYKGKTQLFLKKKKFVFSHVYNKLLASNVFSSVYFILFQAFICKGMHTHVV